MKRNVGAVDRIVRLAAGLAIVGAGVWLRSRWGAVGLLPILTAIAGRCVIYSILGMSTSGRPG